MHTPPVVPLLDAWVVIVDVTVTTAGDTEARLATVMVSVLVTCTTGALLVTVVVTGEEEAVKVASKIVVTCSRQSTSNGTRPLGMATPPYEWLNMLANGF